MIWKDEIVEEVREVREKHAAQFDYDISAICADIRKKQKAGKREIISSPKKETEVEEADLLKAA